MIPTSAYNLEQDILSAWNIVDDINLLNELVLESEDFQSIPPAQQDTIANFLSGLSTIYGFRFNKLFDTYNSLLSELHTSNIPSVSDLTNV